MTPTKAEAESDARCGTCGLLECPPSRYKNEPDLCQQIEDLQREVNGYWLGEYDLEALGTPPPYPDVVLKR